MSQAELIDSAEEITAVKAAYYCITEELALNKAEADMLLRLSDPLQTIAEAMLENGDLNDIYGVIDDMVRTEKVMEEEAKFRAMDLAENSRQQKPSVLAKLKSNMGALAEPRPKAAAKKLRGEER